MNKTVNITPLLVAAGISAPEISIVETPSMYPYKEKIVDNWAYFTAVGCKALKGKLDREKKEVTTAAIVGICSGVEGITFTRVFAPTLKKLIVTDVTEDILLETVKNISNGSEGLGVEVTPLLGSFCEPLELAGIKVDVVHANIPNLPSTGEEDLRLGAEKGTFLPASLYEGYHPPIEFVGWALGAQFAYLESAKRILEKGGSVVTELGGRVPYALVEKLFDQLELDLEEVIVGYKEQTEALIDFLGYHRMEKEYGVIFEFYPLEKLETVFQVNNIKNPTSAFIGKEVKRLLEPYKISAEEALQFFERGEAVGHTVHIFRGTKNKHK